jgi:hypothetical protein
VLATAPVSDAVYHDLQIEVVAKNRGMLPFPRL